MPVLLLTPMAACVGLDIELLLIAAFNFYAASMLFYAAGMMRKINAASSTVFAKTLEVSTSSPGPTAAKASALGSPSSKGESFSMASCFPPGIMYHSNAAEPTEFDSGVCYGKVLVLHKPTQNEAALKSGKYPYAAHMHARKRLWELRLQITFRENVEGEIHFGLEQDKYTEVSRLQRMVSAPLLRTLRSIAKGMHQSFGEDPNATAGEPERSTIVFPFCVMDQLIVTKQGETPPCLTDPAFPSKGLTKANDRRAFQEAMDALKYQSGTTITVGFWSIAQFCDCIGWKAPKRGLMPEIRFGEIGIHPPCYGSLYVLRPRHEWSNVQGINDHRHLDSRKLYLFRSFFWSPVVAPDERRIIEITGADLKCSRENPEPLKNKPFYREMCCM
eukprot:gnl/TRDRNA2_/TRDRNA2_46585_c0_seq1.p1 gnl/TRDRNA2_/TRDRNA2_46585_c0~~gnl/TRDRNA2_/TRDRNA2_46585_c0_seq1.p1  ORF type:complete len:388 (+),score=51.69 gnl/TRDRNA2_/TRDRNA2_46585_c0_seq1:37-1200(+)